MPGLISWSTDKITAAGTYVYDSAIGFTNYVYDTATGISNAVTSRVNAVLATPIYVKNQIANNVSDMIASHAGEVTAQHLAEGWEGAAQGFNPILHPTVLTMPDTRRVFLNALYNNLWTMGLVIGYEGFLHPLLRANLVTENSWADWTIDQAAHLYVVSLAIDSAISSAMSLASLGAALGKEVLPDKNFPPCKHVKDDPAIGIKADVMSTPYFWAKQATVGVISLVPVAGPYLAVPVKALVYGETLVESKLAAGKMCSEDRYEAIARNHGYAFGLGLSMAGSAYVWSRIINALTEMYLPAGVGKSRYVDDAVFNLVYLWYIVAAQLISKPLPGKPLPPKPVSGKPAIKITPDMRAGTDLFRLQRKITDVVIGDVAETVAPLLSGQKGDLFVRLQARLDTRLAHFLRLILLPTTLNARKKFMKRRDAVILFDSHEQKIRDAIKEIRAVSKSGGVQFYAFLNRRGLGSYIVSSTTKGLLDNVILNQDLHDALNDLEVELGVIHQEMHPDDDGYFAIVPDHSAEPKAPVNPTIVTSVESQQLPAPQQVVPAAPVSQSVMRFTASTARTSIFASATPESSVAPQVQSERTLKPVMRLTNSVFAPQSKSEVSLPTPEITAAPTVIAAPTPNKG